MKQNSSSPHARMHDMCEGNENVDKDHVDKEFFFNFGRVEPSWNKRGRTGPIARVVVRRVIQDQNVCHDGGLVAEKICVGTFNEFVGKRLVNDVGFRLRLEIIMFRACERPEIRADANDANCDVSKQT